MKIEESHTPGLPLILCTVGRLYPQHPIFNRQLTIGPFTTSSSFGGSIIFGNSVVGWKIYKDIKIKYKMIYFNDANLTYYSYTVIVAEC